MAMSSFFTSTMPPAASSEPESLADAWPDSASTAAQRAPRPRRPILVDEAFTRRLLRKRDAELRERCQHSAYRLVLHRSRRAGPRHELEADHQRIVADVGDAV